MDEGKRRRRVRELLVPGGEPIGEVGRAGNERIREVPGGVRAGEELFARLLELGKPESVAGYPGNFVNFGGKNRIGFRFVSGSGEPTMDVTLAWLPEVEKLKFTQRYNDCNFQTG